MSEIEQSAPFVLFTGMSGEENVQFHVCCEKLIFLESKSVKDAMIDLIAAYVVFDITYPKSISAFLLFFDHNIVFDLKDKQILPSSGSSY